MIVTVIDRKAMHEAWGRPGLYTIITRKIEIPDTCPQCGGPRGIETLRTDRTYEDGDVAFPHVWNNPCGHVDKYKDLLEHPETVFLG